MSTFDFQHVQLKSDQQIDMHRQASWELSYVMRGNGTRILGNSREAFKEGDIALVPPQMPHQWIFSKAPDDIENITIQFDIEPLRTIAQSIPEVKTITDMLEQTTEAITLESDRKDLADILISMIQASPTRRFALWIEALALIAESKDRRIAGLWKEEGETEQKLNKINIFIECNYLKDITIDDIAKHIGMNKSSLCSFYRKLTGMTLIDKVTWFRIRMAKNLLTTTSLPSQTICFKSGFRDIPHFCRVFKKETGMTPIKFREIGKSGMTK